MASTFTNLFRRKKRNEGKTEKNEKLINGRFEKKIKTKYQKKMEQLGEFQRDVWSKQMISSIK